MKMKNYGPGFFTSNTNKKITASLVLIGACAVWLPSLAEARTFRVNLRTDLVDDNPGDGICRAVNDNPDKPRFLNCSLRAAIMEANAWPGKDTITLGSGKYPLTLGGRSTETAGAMGDLDIVDKLVITGRGIDKTIIDASGLVTTTSDPSGEQQVTVPAPDRIFDIHSPSIVTMDDMTLTGGRIPGDNLGTSDRNEFVCPIIKPADGADGGGILNRGGIALIKNVRFEDNLALCDGGGVENVNDSIMMLTDCEFIANIAIANGGALENDEDSIMIINGAKFEWNDAYENGGAVVNDDSFLMLRNATFDFNLAYGNGGAIWNGDSDPITITGVKAKYNAAHDGGGIFNNDGFMTLRTSTVEHNTPNDIVDENIEEGFPVFN